MIGKNLKDPRHEPTDVCFTVNKDEIMNHWKQHMDHTIAIETCGLCGRQVFMTDEELHLVPLTSNLLQCFKANPSELPAKDSIKCKSLHLVHSNNGDIFKLCDRGLKDNQVVVCNTCHGNLPYAAKTGKPLIYTLAHYDLGKKPRTELQTLTFGEKFVPQIQLKPVHGKRNFGFKGHAFGIEASQSDIVESMVNMLPRHDLGDVMQISSCGDKELTSFAKEILRQGPLNIRMEVIMPWLE